MANAEYEQQIIQWQAKRYTDLVRENGWLAVAGLHWLKEGRNLIGSNPLCEVVLPERGPTYLGIITLKGKTAQFQAANGVPAMINGKRLDKADLKSNKEEHPSFITWNEMRMVLHEHGGKYAIRIWDNKRTERFSLPPLKWFPINKQFRFNGRYTRYPEPKLSGQSDTFGETIEDRLDGFVSFTFEGKKYKLDVTETRDHKLFIKFKDLTSSKETYPPSRYYYSEPLTDGKVVIDFNYSYSPPCAYTPFATCLFAPAQNHLPFRVEAGEIYRG